MLNTTSTGEFAHIKIAEGFRQLDPSQGLAGGITDEWLEKFDCESKPVAARFLQLLRSDGPLVLTAIVPDSPKITTITARTADQVETFVCEHDGKANLYYSVNPTRTPLNKKAKKTDIAAIEYVLGDLDPADRETSEAAKARYLAQLNGGFEPRPTAAIDSGNGIQCLWRLKAPIVLGELVNAKFAPEDQAKIDDAEARIAAVMWRLGAKAGTQNIDRILRLPGTINLPNAKKRKEGRVECQTELLWFDDVEYPLDAFPKGTGGAPANVAKPAVEADNDDGDRDETGSGYGFRFMQDCHDRRMNYQEACAAILADNTKAGEWANRVDERQLVRAWENSKAPPIDPATAAPLYSEEALALAFAERHANTLRYVAKWGRWLIWDGTCWHMDETRKVFTLARELCREIAAKANKPHERKRIASAKTRAAVESLAREDRRLVATVQQWDTDPWLLNTPGGTVDLRIGKLREHRITDYMTRQTAAAPKGGCPRWLTFMQEVTGDDRELQGYLQRISGYFLTGVTTEQELYFFYGSGRNGKGVWILTVSGIMHDYHRSTPIETFTVARSERHPTDLAGLAGARLVTAAETEEGRRWSEARIKEVTGGDKISARLMRQDFFDFFPQFKPLFAGNTMPKLRTVNKAITARFKRIPFAVTFSTEQINKNLAEELKAEWPGILAWMIEGCLEWQRIGLCPPKAVTDATESYLDNEDVIGEWIDECCVCDANAWENSTSLFGSWKGWATTREEWVGPEKDFTKRLEDRGFKRQKNKEQTKRGFAGLRLKTPDEAAKTKTGSQPAGEEENDPDVAELLNLPSGS